MSDNDPQAAAVDQGDATRPEEDVKPSPDTANRSGQRILMIQAHPDDAEFSCAGTIAKWAAEGAEVHYCSITSGDKGSDDPDAVGAKLADTREHEQREAAKILGVRSVTFLGYLDATLIPDLTLRRDLVRVIRRLKPDVLVCQDPTMRYAGQEYINHPDHVAAGDAALAAVFPSARDPLTFPELIDEGLAAHKTPEVYLFGAREPDVWIDVTDSLDKKIAALKAHASQIKDWDPTEMMRDWARETAARHPDRPDGFGDYAEAFKYIKID